MAQGMGTGNIYWFVVGGLLVLILLACICFGVIILISRSEQIAQVASVEEVVNTPAPTPEPESQQHVPGEEPQLLEETPTEQAQPAYELTDNTKRSYLTLLFLEAITVMVEEEAQLVQSGQVDRAEAQGALLAAGMFLETTNKALQQPPPDQNMQAAWGEGQAALPLVQHVIKKWFNQEITAANVEAELLPAKAQVARMMEIADRTMSEQYGVDEAELGKMREEVMANMRDSLAEAARQESVEPTETPVAVCDCSDDLYNCPNFLSQRRRHVLTIVYRWDVEMCMSWIVMVICGCVRDWIEPGLAFDVGMVRWVRGWSVFGGKMLPVS